MDYESELFESEQGQSYDIASDLDYICHRRRSNTAQRLDRLKKEKINQSRTKTIVWRCNSPTSSQSEERLSQDSPTATGENSSESNKLENGASHRRSKSPPRKSGLTRLLEKFPSIPKNPFDIYAQFDGGMSETVPVKRITIFIAVNQQSNPEVKVDANNEINHHNNNSSATNIDPALKDSNANNLSDNSNVVQPPANLTNKNLPPSPPTPSTNNKNPQHLEVVIVSTARVQDLIGLICWQYTNENREPKLQDDINCYCLMIAEDNGEVDPDFPSLNPKEPLSKFNFPSLALTEKTEEKVRTYNDNYANGNIYNHRPPSLSQNVITSSVKMSKASSRFAAFTRILFKDAKLDTNH